MTTKKADKPDTTVWLKADGKTEIELNNEPANAAQAKANGWKPKK